MAKDIDEIKIAVSDTMSDFYNEVIRKKFDHIDKNFEHINHEISDLKLTSTALVKM